MPQDLEDVFEVNVLDMLSTLEGFLRHFFHLAQQLSGAFFLSWELLEDCE